VLGRVVPALAVGLASVLLAAPARAEVSPAPVVPAGCLTSSTVYDGAQPWPLRRLAVERSWPLARGYGVTVAVVGSGIDADNGQFAPGQVLPGLDLLGGGDSADDDCDGSGTFVAGLIAARPHPATTVTGLAPDAQLLPVRVHQSVGGTTEATDPEVLAQGIEYAAAEGARVIVAYQPVAGPSDRLAAAVRTATAAGAVVVVGSNNPTTSTTEAAAGLALCAVPEVVGVAGVDGNGTVVAGSCTGPDVDLAAPGAGLVSVSAGAVGPVGHVTVDGGTPGYASGYVAGALALVMSYEPGLTGTAAAARLERTADRPASGGRDDRSGWGVVDPYAALSMPARDAGQQSGVRAADEGTFRRHRAPVPPDHSGAILAGVFLAGGAVLVLVAAVTARAGRRRGWRPGRRTAPTTE
jgi:hypothetical protein